MTHSAPSLFGTVTPAVVGHRGAPLVHPENTPASFGAAAAAGATWVELDVRLAVDGSLAVHHDPLLPDGRAVMSLDRDQLGRAGVHALPEVLTGLPPGLGVDLEVKNLPGEPDHDDSMAVVAALVEHLPLAGGRPVVVSSFNPMVLLDLADRAPDVPRALLTIGVGLSAGVEAAEELGCAGLFCHHTTEALDDRGVAQVHDAGLSLMVWTVDDHATARQLVLDGVDAICTNDPAGLASALDGLTRSG